MKDIISLHIADFFTVLNIKPFKGINKANIKNNHLTGKHYGQVLVILNAVIQSTVRYMSVSTSPEGRGGCGLRK
jgi:hypothetical protein